MSSIDKFSESNGSTLGAITWQQQSLALSADFKRQIAKNLIWHHGATARKSRPPP
jgi:hypothetical protein